MKNILVIESSPRKSASISRKLTQAIVDKLKAANPGAAVKVHDLAAHPFPHLEESTLAAFYTPVDKHTDENKKAVLNSTQAIDELKAADVIVLGVPMYNFGIPSVLKAWVDHICRAGFTFQYTASGPKGLVKGKKIYLAIASGGVYTEGSMKAYDFTESYLRGVLGFLGMTDIQAVRAEGISVPGIQDTALEKGIQSIRV